MATAVLLDVHVKFWFVAFAGAIVAFNCCVDPKPTVTVVGLTETPVTATTGAFVLVKTKYS
ncbi:hypothetical protein D3C86_2237920 [compost metagenome]